MGTRFVRLCSLVGALVLSLGTFIPAHADTNGNVTVTGSIVASPLSMTITETSIGFGNLDSAGTAQTGSPSAIGFRTTDGAFWVAESGIHIAVSSPTGWVGRVCEGQPSTPPPGGIAFEYVKPTTLQTANSSYDSHRIPGNCTTPVIWRPSGSSGQSSATLYLTTKVGDADAAASFSMKLTFSVASS